MRPRLLDLFCCEGGAAVGYHRAGFDVIGVDIDAQPLARYPFPSICGDALQIGAAIGHRFDAIHASPPCQRHSTSTASTGNPDGHPDLIEPTRQLLAELGVLSVIENVEGAPLRRDLRLCGSMFGLKVQRHRVFELGGWFTLAQPRCDHRSFGGPVVDVTGHAGGKNQTPRAGYPIKYHDADHARRVMGMPWASARGCTEAIPPAYTEHIGHQLLAAIRSEVA